MKNMKKYIFTSDYTASFSGIFGGTSCAPQKFFKKGTVYPLEKAGISPSWMQFYIASTASTASTTNTNCGYSIPGNVVKEYTIKNSIKNDTMASSYLGESIIAKKSQQTKNILVIIAMLAIIIVAYLAVTGKLFKSLELN